MAALPGSKKKGGGGLRAKRTGTVTRIADALQPGTRTLLTEIDVPNTDGTLAPAIYCTVELHIPRKVNSVLVPSEAIRPAGHRRRQWETAAKLFVCGDAHAGATLLVSWRSEEGQAGSSNNNVSHANVW